MSRFMITAAAAALVAGSAMAGGIERGNAPYDVLFERKSNVKLGFSSVSPRVSGEYASIFGGGETGDMAPSYSSFSFGMNQYLTDNFSLALLVHDPFGADAYYMQGFYTGLQADWNSTAATLLGKYKVTDRISVFGGVRGVHSQADITIPQSLMALATDPNPFDANTPAGGPTPPTVYTDYNAQSSQEMDLGFVVGAAYEIPEIALRIAAIYESGITHDFEVQESFNYGSWQTETKIDMPHALTLDVQTGVAPGTLVFGSVRMVKWTDFAVGPDQYVSQTGSNIVDYDNDSVTWTLGVGRAINENLSLFARGSYEKANGGAATRLSPTDGRTSLGLGGSFTDGNLKLTGGIELIHVGDAVDSENPVIAGTFKDNVAVGVGAQLTILLD